MREGAAIASAAGAPEDLAGPVLSLQGVSKGFTEGKRRVEALRGVTFAAAANRVTGLIGPDAAGKTTLIRLAAGLLRADEGQLRVLGIDVASNAQAVQSLIGYMPQRFGLYEDLSVQQNLDLYADLQGVHKDSRRERYEALLHMTGLGLFTSRLAGKLSGGMKQKLGLACTLVRSPRLLLLDEPTVGVDPISRRELWEIVYRLVREEGMSVLLSTSYLDEAERCDDLALLHEGRLLGQGPPEHFRAQVAGRTFAVRSEGLVGAKRRRAQGELIGLDGVLDAVIDGDFLRVVTSEPAAPRVDGLIEGAVVTPVEPRFEDSFVAMLSRRPVADGEPAPVTAVGLNGARARRCDDSAEAIVVHDLRRRFGSFDAVKGISFQVRRGEIFGLLGANGAGKTTTFRMLCGLLPASEGTLSVAGVDLRSAPAAARQRVGYMSQKFSLYGTLSPLENLRFFSSAYNLAGRRQAEEVQRMLDIFELRAFADAPSATLPLGYKQRLAMACALMHQPDILFLDEPTSGVDPLARREFWGRINDLADQGVTVMVTTHFMAEAENCDRVAIMASGELLEVAPPHEIRARARTAELREPTMEDAFVALVQAHEGAGGEG